MKNSFDNFFVSVRNHFWKISLLSALLYASVASATPSLSIIDAHQRYPWNNLADVTYTVSGLENGHTYKLMFKVGTSENVTRTIDADSSPESDGTYTTFFNVADGFPEKLMYGGYVQSILIDISAGGMKPSDATGNPIQKYGDVMVIDVSGGASANAYAVEYYRNVDMGYFNCSTYKTDKIVLRKVPSETYGVGGEGSNGDNTARVAMTDGFYIGMFPVTMGQYQNVMGSVTCYGNVAPGSQRTETSMRGVSWDELRDSMPVDVAPVASVNGGFLARLLAKAKYNGQPVGGFDLPTEFQWEIACRAGVGTKYYWGTNENLIDDYAWWYGNSDGFHHAVGGKLPNEWGLYDFLGSCFEWCRDAYEDGHVANSIFADVPCSYGYYRSVRGGSYGDYKNYCVPAFRGRTLSYETFERFGFRLYCSSTFVPSAEFSPTDMPANTYTSWSVAFYFDTRSGVLTYDNINYIPDVACSGSNWGSKSGHAQLTYSHYGIGIPTESAIEGFENVSGNEYWRNWDLGPGTYELKHTSTAEGASPRTAMIQVLAQSSNPVHFTFDTRDDYVVREPSDMLPIAFSQSNWTGGEGKWSIRCVPMNGSEQNCYGMTGQGCFPYYNFITNAGNNVYQFYHSSTVEGTGTYCGRIKVSTSVPPNDNFANAEAIPHEAHGSISGYTDLATLESGEPIVNSFPSADSSVWYKWSSVSPANLKFSVNSMTYGFSPVICIYSGSSLGSLKLLGRANKGEWIEKYISANVDYYICVSGCGSNAGDFSLGWAVLDGVPANDDFANAQALTGLQGTITIDNALCTMEQGEPANEVFRSGSQTIWYKITPGCPGSVRVILNPFTYEACLGIYTSSRVSVDQIQPVNENGEKHGALSQTIFFNCEPETTYYIRVASDSPVSGEDKFDLDWLVTPQPENTSAEDAVWIYRESEPTTGFNHNAGVASPCPVAEYDCYNAVWWKWKAPSSGTVEFSTKGSDFDTVLAVCTLNGANATVIGISDDYKPGDRTSCVRFKCTEGTTYYINVGGYQDAVGQIVLSWRMNFPYAVFYSTSRQLNFYWDSLLHTDEGEVFEIEDDFPDSPPWIEINQDVQYVEFDRRFRFFEPKSLKKWFFGCENLREIIGIEYLTTDNVKIFDNMFSNCSSLRDIDVSWFKTGSALSMTGMFTGCGMLGELDLSAWDVRHEDMEFTYMFAFCTSLERIIVSDRFEVNSVFTLGMFRNCKSLVGGAGTTFNNEHEDGEYARVDGYSSPGYFTAAKTAKAVYDDDDDSFTFYFDNLDHRGVESPTVAPSVIVYDIDLNECSVDFEGPEWASHNVHDWVEKVVFDESFRDARPKSTKKWFYEMGSLTSIEGIENLDTSKTVDMQWMFYDCQSLETIDLSNFDTSKVRNFYGMFTGCESLTELDFRGFNTENAVSMGSMFEDCSGLTNLYLHAFDTSNVEYMDAMFAGCTGLENIDFGAFDTSKVSGWDYMFSNCSKLKNLDLTFFTFGSESYGAEGMFNYCTNLQTILVFEDGFKLPDHAIDCFRYCESLVGGEGTVCSGNGGEDGCYGRIDGGVSAPGYFTLKEDDTDYDDWAAEEGLLGSDSGKSGRSLKLGGRTQNAFVYKYGEGLLDGTLNLLEISIGSDGKPVITTPQVIKGRVDFTPAVIGTDNLQDWSSPVFLENNYGNDWTLPAGEDAKFFRLRLIE